MRWFRSYRLSVASLALFALACQFVLAFGHVDLGRSAGNSNDWVVAATAGKAVSAAASIVASADLPLSPRQNKPGEPGDDFCAICASIGLTGALVIPGTPAVPPGISFFKQLHWSFAATAASSIDHFYFSARGPPRAPEATA
jgi:hypothetical protein